MTCKPRRLNIMKQSNVKVVVLTDSKAASGLLGFLDANDSSGRKESVNCLN